MSTRTHRHIHTHSHKHTRNSNARSEGDRYNIVHLINTMRPLSLLRFLQLMHALPFARHCTARSADDCGPWIMPKIFVPANSSVDSAAFMRCSSSLRIAIVESGGVFTPEITWPQLNFNLQQYGLPRGSKNNSLSRAWSYRSALVGLEDRRSVCRRRYHPFLGIGKAKKMSMLWSDNPDALAKCYIAGTVRAFWLGPSIYGMEITLSGTTLAGDSKIMVSVHGGIDCDVPLEDMDNKNIRKFIKNSLNPPCVFGLGNSDSTIGSVIASFKLDIAPSDAALLKFQNVRRFTCDYQSLVGSWQYNPVTLRALEFPKARWVPAFNDCRTLNATFRFAPLPSCSDFFGIVGGSSTGPMWRYSWSEMCRLSHDAFCNSNVEYENTINCGIADRCLISNTTEVHDACLMKLLPSKKVLFFSPGARMSQFAPQEIVENFLNPVV